MLHVTYIGCMDIFLILVLILYRHQFRFANLRSRNLEIVRDFTNRDGSPPDYPDHSSGIHNLKKIFLTKLTKVPVVSSRNVITGSRFILLQQYAQVVRLHATLCREKMTVYFF